MDTLVAQEPRIREASTLGNLLSGHRANFGLTPVDIARSSGRDVGDVLALESGTHDLSGDQLAAMVDCYQISSDVDVARSVVIIDLTHGSVGITRSWRRKVHLPADRVLVRYLQLLYHSKGLSSGATVSIKDVDLSVLRGSLALRRDDVKHKVHDLTGQAKSHTRRIHVPARLLALAAITLTAGVVVIGPELIGSDAAGAVNNVPAAAVATVTVPTVDAAPIQATAPSTALAVSSATSATPIGPPSSSVLAPPAAAVVATVTISPAILEYDPILGAQLVGAALADIAAAVPVAVQPAIRWIESAPAAPTPGGNLGTALVIER